MPRLRRHLWRAAGLVLAATTTGPALAQALPGTPAIMALPESAAPDTVGLPPPRPVPPTAACDGTCGTARGHWFWPAWQQRREAHAAKMQAKMWGYPDQFVAPPLGGTIHQHFRTMVANGEAARMVLYHYDFLDGRDALNLRGRDQLAKIVALASHNSFPIIIERTPENPGLAEARRQAVLNVLAHNALPIGPERVVIGPAIATGMSGVEAERLSSYFLFNLASQGTPLPPTSITITGGFGGLGTGIGQGMGGFGGGFGTTGTAGGGFR